MQILPFCCTEFNGGRVLMAMDYSQSCDTSQGDFAITLYLSYFVLLVYGGGLPAYMWWHIRRSLQHHTEVVDEAGTV